MIYRRREGSVFTCFVILKNFYVFKAKLRELSTFVGEQCTPSLCCPFRSFGGKKLVTNKFARCWGKHLQLHNNDWYQTVPCDIKETLVTPDILPLEYMSTKRLEEVWVAKFYLLEQLLERREGGIPLVKLSKAMGLAYKKLLCVWVIDRVNKMQFLTRLRFNGI